MQALLVYLFVELLQKCQVVQLESLKTSVAECIVMNQVGVEDPAPTEEEDDEDESEKAEADTGLLQPDAVALHHQAESLQPNLHMLGHLFLSRPMSHAFNCILLFQFISIGISYVLAGSEAYAALLNVSHVYVIPAFTWILTLAILLAHTIIQPITSLLTLLKGILLIVTVAVTFAVGSEVGLQSSSDFSQMGKPFLMGTVALGGIVNVMPLLFSQISHNKTQILWFRRAVLGGLTTCTVLNVLWCWAVLEIVPQTSIPERRPTAEATQPNSSSLSGPRSSISPLLYSNISLEEALQLAWLKKYTPEERRKECRREMFRELKEMEMERRRAALDGIQTCRREKEERDKETERLNRQKERIEEERRQEAKQREESRANEQKALENQKQDQLKKERLQWKKVMMVEEEPNTRPRFTLSDLKKEQQWRSDEAELCRLRKVDNEASFKCLTSELKGQEQSKRKTLSNNRVGEQSTDSETDDETLPPNGSTHTPSTEKASPDFEATPKPTESLLSLQKKQSFGLWFEKYWDQVERRRRREEARRLKAEERYAKWAAFKERRQRLLSEQVH